VTFQFPRTTPEELVALVSDLERAGGHWVHLNEKRVRLPFIMFITYAGRPAALFHDPVNNIFPVFEMSGWTGHLKDVGYLTAEDVSGIARRQGLFGVHEGGLLRH
jgi:hypothetical protein